MDPDRRRILIAGSDQATLEQLGHHLGKAGHCILEAGDVTAALHLIRHERPDFILVAEDLQHLKIVDLVAALQEIHPLPTLVIGSHSVLEETAVLLLNSTSDRCSPSQPDNEAQQGKLLTGTSPTEPGQALLERQRLELELKTRTSELLHQNLVLELEIEQRHRQEQLVEQARKDWEKTFDALPDLIAIVDTGGRIKRMNRAMRSKLERFPDEVNNYYTALCRICEMGGSSENLQSPPEKPHSFEIEDEVLGGNFEVTILPYHQLDDGNSGIVVIARDTTARKLAERERDIFHAQLLHAQKLEAVGQLASGIAHEINTPIQFIAANLDFINDAFTGFNDIFNRCIDLVEECKGNKLDERRIIALGEDIELLDWDYLQQEIPSAIDQSKVGTERVASIVRAMKEFSHPSPRKKVPADLNQIVRTTVTIARNEWKYCAEVTLDLAPGLPPVPCHRDEIGQVLLNILINAAHSIQEKVGKFDGKRKGRITIVTRHEGNDAIITVQDTGCGIGTQIQDRIFDPFFTTKEVGFGTGQGLAIAHDVITSKHKGSITFHSEVDEGTTFCITLPLDDTEESSPQQID
jgi:two-component system, NtrC family, sensor kinase